MNTHQVHIIVVDTRILCCVADSLQERRFASIGPSDYEDTKVSIFCFEVIGITTVVHNGCCGCGTAWEQYHGWQEGTKRRAELYKSFLLFPLSTKFIISSVFGQQKPSKKVEDALLAKIPRIRRPLIRRIRIYPCWVPCPVVTHRAVHHTSSRK